MEPAADTPAPLFRWRPQKTRGRWFRGPLAGAALVLLCLTVYVPGFTSLPAVDRDESRFAQASRQMLESVALPPQQQEQSPVETWDSREAPGAHSGGLAIPMVHRRMRLNKPPLIYWLQSAAAGALTGGQPLRDAIWMYRLPSALAGIATVLLTWGIGRRMLHPRAAWLGAAMLALAPAFVWEAHQARADMVLVAITTAAMGCQWMIWRGDSRRQRGLAGRWVWPAAMWIFIGLGILTKGPITPLVAGLTALALCAATRRWRWLGATRPLLGILIVAAMVAPWVWAVAHRIGWEQYAGIVFKETLGRSASPAEGHLGPPGYHALFAIILLWPGSMLIVLALPRAWRRARGASAPGTTGKRAKLLRPFTGHPAELFLLCWLLPSWIVFELVITKLPHYTMPLYPALALLCARAVFAADTGRLLGLTTRAIHRALIAFNAFSVAIVLIVTGAGMVMLPREQGAVIGAIGAGALMLLIRAICSISTGRFVAGQITLLAAAAGLWIGLLGLALPRAEQPWVTRKIAAQLPAAPPPVAAVGYHEDSLMFALRGHLARLNADNIPAWLSAHDRAILILPADMPAPAGLTPIGEAAGFNYAGGRSVDLVILRKGPP